MTVEEKLALAEKLTVQARDYREIYNTISGQMYYLQVQEQEAILKQFWSKRDDISFGSASGRTAVYDFFVNETNRKKRRKLELANQKYGTELHEANMGVGDLESRLVSTPYIVVSDDRETAKSLWFSPAVKAEIGADGNLHGKYMQEKISIDFIREADGWKIWHYNVYPDFTVPLPDYTFDDSRYQGRTFEGDGSPNEEHTNFRNNERPAGMPMPYCAESIPIWKPPFPEEYYAWTQSEDFPIM